jgi:hypothetical protein
MALSLLFALSLCRTTLTGLAAVPVVVNQLGRTRMIDDPIHHVVQLPHGLTCPIAQSGSPMIVAPPALISHLLPVMMICQEAHATIGQVLNQETRQPVPIWSMVDYSLQMIFHQGQGADGVAVTPLAHSLLRFRPMVNCLTLTSNCQLALAGKADVQVLLSLLPHNLHLQSEAKFREFTLIDSSTLKVLHPNRHQIQQ